MIRGLLIHPIGWILLFILAVAVAYWVMSAILGTSASGHRLWQVWVRKRRMRRQLADADLSWAIDVEPREEKQVRVQCRSSRDGQEWDETMPASWLPKAPVWQGGLEHAEQERQLLTTLAEDHRETWERLRRTGWQVIRLAETVEKKMDEPALPATSNRAGILKWLDAGLAGLHFLSHHREPEQQLEQMETSVAEASHALEQAKDESRASLQTTLEAHQQRLAHLRERLDLLPRVQTDLDCLQANLLLAAERLESALSPVQSDPPLLFSPNDAPLVQLDLPLLERLRAERS